MFCRMLLGTLVPRFRIIKMSACPEHSRDKGYLVEYDSTPDRSLSQGLCMTFPHS